MSRQLNKVAIAVVAGLLLPLVTLTIFPASHTVASSVTDTARTFASPAEAGEALDKAAKSGDKAALLSIFGPDGRELLFSGDPAVDQNALNDFVTAYDRMHRWGNIKAGGKILYVGAENFPFPIPLMQDASGRWYFDAASGADEILARRIGRNELVAIAALGALANAQQQYVRQGHSGENAKQYAQKFVSDPGSQDGLYWPAAEGQPPSPLGQMGDFAKVIGQTKPGEKPQPFRGYYFRILPKQGGFAILAYPSEYRNTGIMSFIVEEDGVVHQKDLGERTPEVAAGITADNRGDGWEPVTTQ